MAIELFGNAAGTTVGAGGIDSSATSLPVTSSAAPFPQAGNFRLIIDSEILLVTAVPDGTHFTVTRGAEGTTPAAHAAGAVVTQVVTVGAMTQFGADQVGTGADASLPSAARAGMLYLPNDNVTPYVYDGAAWKTFGLLDPLHAPPLTGWTAANSPNALTTYNGCLALPVDAAAGVNVKGYERPTPATPYSVDVAFTQSNPIVNYFCAGAFWRSTGDGLVTIANTVCNQANNTATSCTWKVDKLNSLTSYNASYNFAHGQSCLGMQGTYAGIHWVRLADDGTNRKISLSGNGLDWEVVFTIGRTDWHTPDRIGFGSQAQNSYWGGTMRLLSWYEH